MTNGEATVAGTRGRSALLDVVDDRLCIRLGDEGRPVGVIPGSLLTTPAGVGEMRLGLEHDHSVCARLLVAQNLSK